MLVGIDVSKWQKEMNWQKAKSAGAHFAFIRAGSITMYTGEPYTDHQFLRNAKLAPDYMPVGVYLYFRPQHDPIKQANYFIDLIRDKRAKLPPVLDLEEDGDLGSVEITDAAIAFASRIYQRMSRWPIIYGRAEWLNRNLILVQQWAAMSLWIARYNAILDGPWSDGKCVPKFWDIWKFWQWSARNGRGPDFGAESASIDLNFFNGDEQDFELYLMALDGDHLVRVKRNWAVSLKSGPAGPAIGATWKGATWPVLSRTDDGKYYRVEAWIRADTVEKI
jgi:lysozyme